jgi:hypothetical protein
MLGRPATGGVGGAVQDNVAAGLAEGEVGLPAGGGEAGLAGEGVGHDQGCLLRGGANGAAGVVGEGEGALDDEDEVLARGDVHAHGELGRERGLVPDLHQPAFAGAPIRASRIGRGWSGSMGKAEPGSVQSRKRWGQVPAGSERAARRAARVSPGKASRTAVLASAASDISQVLMTAVTAKRSPISGSCVPSDAAAGSPSRHSAAKVSGKRRPALSRLGTITPVSAGAPGRWK